MFFEADSEHGLPRDPFKACIVPRPIGWISTIDASGNENLAPYSFFNAVAERPRMVMFCVNGQHEKGGAKDTLRNVMEVPEFVVNMSTWELREQMNTSCAPLDSKCDEFQAADLEKSRARLVRPSLVKAAPINLECLVHQMVDLPPDPLNGRNCMIIGRVIGIHIQDNILINGRVNFDGLRPLGRLGYAQYVVAKEEGIFDMRRPD